MPDELATFVRVFASSMQAHRLTKFGWEPAVNELPPERMRDLAKQVGPELSHALFTAADLKEAKHGSG